MRNKVTNMSTPTKRRSFLAKAFAGLTTLGLAPVAAHAQDRVEENFLHVVFFWFRNPNYEKSIIEFMQGLEPYLQRIDTIETYHIGRPAGTPRDVVDNSYSVSLVLSFKSKEDQDIYQEHQAHKDYIKRYQHLWERVQVYDTWSGG
ncbi:MAG: Dabb family protein [Bacteroidota bacterium]